MKDLKKRRIKAKISQAELGELLGVTGRTIRNWESGETEVKIGYIDTIKRVLKQP